jgi:CRISPR/Cas system-associated endonuclease/helicase Cas3
MKQFVINKNSTLPYLEIEAIHDGRHTYKKLYLALQAADVTFTMTNIVNGVKKIANAPCYIVPFDEESCEDKFKIQYQWNKRDTSEAGIYVGTFKIKFNDNITIDGMTFPKGDLIVPIAEELQIVINDGSIKI